MRDLTVGLLLAGGLLLNAALMMTSNPVNEFDRQYLADRGHDCAHLLRSEFNHDEMVQRVVCIESPGAGFTVTYLVDKVTGDITRAS